MSLQCWKCGHPLKDVRAALMSRYEECSVCKADQHVCLMCRDYDPMAPNGCREERADYVLDKDKANFCDFFRARPNAHRKTDNSAAADARQKLAALFGEAGEDTPAPPTATPQTEAERALAELKRLFGEE